MNTIHLFNDLYYDINSISSIIVKKLFKKKDTHQYRLLKNNVCLFYQSLSLSHKNKFISVLNDRGYVHNLDDRQINNLLKFHSVRFEEFCNIYTLLHGTEQSNHPYLSSKYELCKNNFNMFYASLGSVKVNELNKWLELL